MKWPPSSLITCLRKLGTGCSVNEVGLKGISIYVSFRVDGGKLRLCKAKSNYHFIDFLLDPRLG